jgi:CDP-diacylglycerol pyrophosphatase
MLLRDPRWKQPPPRHIMFAVLIIVAVVVAVVWAVQAYEKKSQESKKVMYESCLREATAKHMSDPAPMPRIEDIQACDQKLGIK